MSEISLTLTMFSILFASIVTTAVVEDARRINEASPEVPISTEATFDTEQGALQTQDRVLLSLHDQTNKVALCGFPPKECRQTASPNYS